MFTYYKEYDNKIYNLGIQLCKALNCQYAFTGMRVLCETIIKYYCLEYGFKTTKLVSTFNGEKEIDIPLANLLGNTALRKRIYESSGFNSFDLLEDYCKEGGNEASHDLLNYKDDDIIKGIYVIYDLAASYFYHRYRERAPKLNDEKIQSFIHRPINSSEIDQIAEYYQSIAQKQETIISSFDDKITALSNNFDEKMEGFSSTMNIVLKTLSNRIDSIENQNFDLQQKSSDLQKDMGTISSTVKKQGETLKSGLAAVRGSQQSIDSKISELSKSQVSIGSKTDEVLSKLGNIQDKPFLRGNEGHLISQKQILNDDMHVTANAIETEKKSVCNKSASVAKEATIFRVAILPGLSTDCTFCNNTHLNKYTIKKYAVIKSDWDVAIIESSSYICPKCGIIYQHRIDILNETSLIEQRYGKQVIIDSIETKNQKKNAVKRSMYQASYKALNAAVTELSVNDPNRHSNAIQECEASFLNHEPMKRLAYKTYIEASKHVSDGMTHVDAFLDRHKNEFNQRDLDDINSLRQRSSSGNIIKLITYSIKE